MAHFVALPEAWQRGHIHFCCESPDEAKFKSINRMVSGTLVALEHGPGNMRPEK